jgi:hypothetical protein
MGEEVTAAHARLEQNLEFENRAADVKKEETRSLNMIKISEGKRKRALENWEIQGSIRQRAQERVHAANVPFEVESVMETQASTHGNMMSQQAVSRVPFMQLDYLRCPYKKDKSIDDAKTFLTQGMSRLELSEIPVGKWSRYLMANMGNSDRLWAETNINLESVQQAASKEEFMIRFVKPFLDADNGYVTARLNLAEYHSYTWETSKLSYPAFVKELGTLAARAEINDHDASTIMLFIQKQPEEIKGGLHNLAVQQGPYVSLRTCCRSAASLSYTVIIRC